MLYDASHPGSKRSQAGFTYLGVLFAVALIGIGLAAVSEVWVTNADRQKIAQIDWIGQQYVNAIRSYYYANTGSIHLYPGSVDDLVEDKRYLGIKRYLRSKYQISIGDIEPSVGVVLAPSGGINGVEISIQLSDRFFTQRFVFNPNATP